MYKMCVKKESEFEMLRVKNLTMVSKEDHEALQS